MSADTVIYIGGGAPGESTDDEHPPIFMPHHIRKQNTGLTRLGSLDHLLTHSSSTTPTQAKQRSASANAVPNKTAGPTGVFMNQNPLFVSERGSADHTKVPKQAGGIQPIPVQIGFIRHQPGVSQIVYPQQTSLNQQLEPNQSQSPRLGTKTPSEPVVIGPLILGELQHFTYNIYQDQNKVIPVFQQSYLLPPPQGSSQQQFFQQLSQKKVEQMQDHSQKQHIQTGKQEKTKVNPNTMSDEYWVDGPRISRSKVAAASKAHLEMQGTWIDGPAPPPASPFSYGFMDEHKKLMIAQWVEVQSAQVRTKNTKSPLRKDPPKYQPTVQSKSSDDEYEESNNDSDVETISEEPISQDPSITGSSSFSPKRNPINIFESPLENRTNIDDKQNGSKENMIKEGQPGRPPDESEGHSSPETLAEEEEEPSIDDICSQCEQLAEEYEELSSLLSCEEEECKRQAHLGLGKAFFKFYFNQLRL